MSKNSGSSGNNRPSSSRIITGMSSLSDELTQTVLDCTDWLADFQYWDKAIELKSFPALVGWVNENVDPLLAAEVMKDESNFRIVMQAVLSRFDDVEPPVSPPARAGGGAAVRDASTSPKGNRSKEEKGAPAKGGSKAK